MAEIKTGWTTEWPVVNGIYWARWQSTVSVNTFIVEVIGKRFYMTGRSLICPNHETPAPYEWLGPLSPSDAEQLMELRKLVRAYFTIDPTGDVAGWCEVSNKLMKIVGLNPKQPEKETQ